MSPTLSKLPLKHESPSHSVDLISSLLSPNECTSLISQHSPSLIPVSGSYSSRLRHIFHSPSLSSTLWSRLQPFHAQTHITDSEGQTWTSHSLNPYFRFCKYSVGDGFDPHEDGRRLLGVNEQSFITVNIYLNDVPEMSGGATRILERPDVWPVYKMRYEYPVLGLIQPCVGMAAVFRDSLFHDGEAVAEGEKYLLRTDVVFERDKPLEFDCLYAGLSRAEKGRKALDLAKRLEDGGNMNEAVVWYRKAFRLDPELEKTG